MPGHHLPVITAVPSQSAADGRPGREGAGHRRRCRGPLAHPPGPASSGTARAAA